MMNSTEAGVLGIDTHYAAAVDEAHLFVAQEREGIRLFAFAPSIDLREARRICESHAGLVGEPRRCVAIGERPDEVVRLAMREGGIDWVLWVLFNDAELRYVVKSAMARREDLMERRDVRVPVDLVANIWSGDRRDVAVVSSVSPRGAFIELSEPLEQGSSLRIEMELAGERFRGFARVVHTVPEDSSRPGEPSGVGVTFYGASRDEERLIRKAVGELQSRYMPQAVDRRLDRRPARLFERRLVEAAVDALSGLQGSGAESVMPHQDLHPDKVLAADREPWQEAEA